MTETTTPRLAFGYNDGLPEEGTAAAWGARLIFPNDLPPDRTDSFGSDEAKKRLFGLLTCQAPGLAEYPALLREAGIYYSGVDAEVTLYEDNELVIKANPQASHGYLYVVAYLKGGAA